jgi:hypothetical protein
VIITKNSTISYTVKKNLNRIAQNLNNLYRGSHQAFGENILYVSKNVPFELPVVNARTIPLTGRQHASDSCDSGYVKRRTPAGYIKVDTRDEATMQLLYTKANLFEIKHTDYYWVEPCSDTSYAQYDGKDNSAAAIERGKRGTIQQLSATYNQNRSKYSLK